MENLNKLIFCLSIFSIFIVTGCTQQQEAAETTKSEITSTTRMSTSTTVTAKDTTNPALSTTTTASTTSTTPEGMFIARTADVPSGSSYDFTYGGEKAILVNLDGEYRTYVNECTHQGCPFKLLGGLFKCPCHGSQFNPLTGEVDRGPADRPLTGIKVFVAGDGIYAR